MDDRRGRPAEIETSAAASVKIDTLIDRYDMNPVCSGHIYHIIFKLSDDGTLTRVHDVGKHHVWNR